MPHKGVEGCAGMRLLCCNRAGALEPATSIAPVSPTLPFYDGRQLQGHFVGAYPQPVSGGGPPRRAGRLLMKQFVNAPAKDIPLSTGPSDLTARRLTQPVLEEWHRTAQARRHHLEWRRAGHLHRFDQQVCKLGGFSNNLVRPVRDSDQERTWSCIGKVPNSTRCLTYSLAEGETERSRAWKYWQGRAQALTEQERELHEGCHGDERSCLEGGLQDTKAPWAPPRK